MSKKIMNDLIDNVRLMSPGSYMPCADPRTLTVCPVGRIAHINVYINMHMTKTIPRPWRERLFTRPWRPWWSTKQVPSLELLRTRDGLFGHPVAIAELRKMFARTWETI